MLGGYPLNTCPVSLAVYLDLQELSHFPLIAAPGMRSAPEAGQEGCDGEKRGGWRRVLPRLSSVGLGQNTEGEGTQASEPGAGELSAAGWKHFVNITVWQEAGHL